MYFESYLNSSVNIELTQLAYNASVLSHMSKRTFSNKHCGMLICSFANSSLSFSSFNRYAHLGLLPLRPLTLEFSLYLLESFPWLFVYHMHYLSVHSGVNFSLGATSRKVSYDSADLKRLNICNCIHSNIKLLGDSLTDVYFWHASLQFSF